MQRKSNSLPKFASLQNNLPASMDKRSRKNSIMPSLGGKKGSLLQHSSDKDGKVHPYASIASDFNDELSQHANLIIERDNFDKQSTFSASA